MGPLAPLLPALPPPRQEQPQSEQKEDDEDEDHAEHNVDRQAGGGGGAGGGDQIRAIQVSNEHRPHQAQPSAAAVLQHQLHLLHSRLEPKYLRFWTLAACVWKISLERVLFCF